jgi:hypothetical protein
LHISRAVSYSYVTEFDTYAGFGPVGSTYNFAVFSFRGCFFLFFVRKSKSFYKL